MSSIDLEETGLEKVQTLLFGVQISAWVRGEVLISYHSTKLCWLHHFPCCHVLGAPFRIAAVFFSYDSGLSSLLVGAGSFARRNYQGA